MPGNVRSFVHPDDAVTLIWTKWLQDERLSLAARGILALLLSLPGGEAADEDALAAMCPPGDKMAVARALVELRTHGYLL